MYKIIDLEQNTPEWLNWRKGKATASQSPSVMGESKYFPRTPYEMYLVETGQREVFYNNAMKRGHEFENKALKNANTFLNSNYQPVLAESEEYPNFAASLDGFDPAVKNSILEIKTTKEGSAIWEDGLSIYHWQLTHQCLVMGTQNAILYAYDPDTKTGKPMPFKAKKSDFKKLIKAWEAYRNCIDNMEIPKLTDRDYVEREDEEITSKLNKLESLKEEIKQLQAAEEDLKTQIFDLCEGQPTKAAGHTIYQSTRKGNINYRALLSKLEVSQEQQESYRGKPSTFWVIR